MGVNVNEKSLFRLAALVYGNTADDIHTYDTLLAIIESTLIDEHNRPMQKNEVISSVLENYGIIITEEELNRIISKNSRIFHIEKCDSGNYISVEDDLFAELQGKMSKNIDFYIELYIKTFGRDDSIRDAIYKFMYELTTTNITSYKKMLGTGSEIDVRSESMITVDQTLFSEAEKSAIHDFLMWENAEKDSAVTNIILCCLEYCIVVSGDGVNELAKKHLKKRYVYLDTNIIFRALGINGSHRKEVTRAFLSKCRQAGIHLLVTSYTLREFWDTMKYYIQQTIKLPADNVYLGAYEELCDYNVYSYYYDWKNTHTTLPQKMFWPYLKSAIESIIGEYSIEEDKSNIFAPEVQKRIDEYDKAIRQIKDEDPCYDQPYYTSNKHDAIMVCIAEQRRAEICKLDIKADCMVATSDKQLRYWDYARNKDAVPMVVYPSQLFALLIKLCGRSTNDMKSFVSFINIKPAIKQISISKANAILSAIGTITDDFKTQRLLVSSVFDDEFQKVIISAKDETELFEMSKVHAQKVIDQKLEQQESRIVATEQQVTVLQGKLEEELQLREKERSEYSKQQLASTERSSMQEDLIEKMAFRHTSFQYYLIWTILPVVAIAIGTGVIALFAIGLLGRPDNNITLKLIEWFKTTPIGEKVPDPYGLLISAALTLLASTYVYGASKLFSPKRKAKRDEYKNDYINRLKTKTIRG